MNDIHDALLARLEELRPNSELLPWTDITNALIDLAIAYVKERCPKCGDKIREERVLPGPGSPDPKFFRVCDNPRHALLADAAERLGIGGKE